MRSVSNRKSPLRYLPLVTRDLYRVMPFEVSLVIAFKLLHAALAMAQVYTAAALCDAAGRLLAGQAEPTALLWQSGWFMLAFVSPQLLELIERPVQDLRILVKHQMLIHKLLAHVISMPLIEFEKPDFHDRLYRAKRVVYNNGLLHYFYGYADFLPALLRVAGVMGVLAGFHPLLVLLALLSAVPSLAHKWRLVTSQRGLYEKLSALYRKHDYLWGVLTDRETVKELRAMDAEHFIADKWADTRDKVNDEYFRVQGKATTRELLSVAGKHAAIFAAVSASLALMAGGALSVGQFAACLTAFGSMQAVAEQLAGMLTGQKDMANYVGDYYDFVADDARETGGGQPAGAPERGIALRDVSFRYPGSETYALKNVSLEIRRGERIVIIGENGSGKTTLSKLITGAYDPERGQVMYGGVDIRQTDRDASAHGFSLIAQDFVKYQLTLRENIGISASEQIHNDEKLSRSAEMADIGGVVRRVGGFDAQVGRAFDGFELSGGEWQKLAIARGIHKGADFIILDEPTSALDPLVEYDILTKFVNITQDKTSIIISHRVGLCKFAHRILVMKQGELVETGTHAELLARGGEYARIWEAQAKWYV